MRTLKERLQAAFNRAASPFETPLELFVRVTRFLDHLEEFSSQYPYTFHIISIFVRISCILIGILFALKRLPFSRANPVSRRLNDPPERTYSNRIHRELAYYREFLASAEKCEAGEEIILSGWPGSKLRRPPNDIVLRFAEICARRTLKPLYIFNFTVEEFKTITLAELDAFLKFYKFAEIRFAISTDQERTKRGLPRRSRHSIIVLRQRGIAYANCRRGLTKDFAVAMVYAGKSFQFYIHLLDELQYLTICAEEALNRCRHDIAMEGLGSPA